MKKHRARAFTISAFLFLLFALCALLVSPFPAGAQETQADPPDRVARLNLAQGSVSFQVQGDSEWVQADPNRPLTTGDNIWADQNSRAEVHIESTAIRLSNETGLSFLNLDDRTVQLQLPQGTIEVHLRQLSAGDAFEVDTPNLAFTLTRAGEYVISTDPNGSSTNITVREGEGQATGGGDSWELQSGQSYSFNGTDQLTYGAHAMRRFDDFEDWCQSRDQLENSSVSARYVSRDVDGYYDLDQYGDWDASPDYGEVWYPRSVAVDWVPYHVGHWVFIAPWGWTWVDDEPWGFAPFHYGRWALVGARWGWIPGPLVVRPVYAPALVAFVGGPGFGLSVSFGGGFTGTAWFPLGPRDVFVPGYRCSPSYVQVINVTNTRVVNVTQVTNVYNTVIVNRDSSRLNYTYAGNSRAVTAVSRDTFLNARPVARESVRINDTQFRDVHVVSSASPSPTRGSYIAAGAKASTNHPAVPFSQRPVVANLPPRVSVQSPRAPQNNGPQNNAPSFNGQGPASNRGQNPTAPNNSGFHTFAQPGNNGARPQGQPEPAPQRGNAPMPPSNTPQNASRPPNVNGSLNTPPDNGGAKNNVPSNTNSNGNSGFRPFQRPTTQPPATQAPPQTPAPAPAVNQPPANVNRNASAPGSSGTTSPPADNSQQRYRFSPPVKARDDNYDVHPPLNQYKPDNQSSAPRPEQHQAPAPRQPNSNSKESRQPQGNNRSH